MRVSRSSGRVPHDVRLTAPTDGRVRLPAWWRLVYWDGTGWLPAAETVRLSALDLSHMRQDFGKPQRDRLKQRRMIRHQARAALVHFRLGRGRRRRRALCDHLVERNGQRRSSKRRLQQDSEHRVPRYWSGKSGTVLRAPPPASRTNENGAREGAAFPPRPSRAQKSS